jgi:S1-C subfamily serine protease
MKETRYAARRWGDKSDGTLGLAALSRLELIVDGKNSMAYLQSKTTLPPVYPHNRLAAVFVPTVTHTNEAVALVVPGGPAYEAGVRNGDILLQVDEVRVVGWSYNWLSRFGMPAGTKLHLMLQRDGTNFEAVATLRQILPPTASQVK